MIPGIVSNCWPAQLDAGADLSALIAEAAQRGYRAIELRQTCLGKYETDDHAPIPERLSALPRQFPKVRFNIAINIAFMSARSLLDEPLLAAARAAAVSVAGQFSPHLRLVDLYTVGQRLSDIAPDVSGKNVAQLARTLTELNGMLSIEHSRQPWAAFRKVFDIARDQLDRDRDALRICFDPVNLLSPGDETDPVEITSSLSNDEVSMVHFKQRRDGRSCKTIGDGEIDWQRVIEALHKNEVNCPGLLEIDPHAEIWSSLSKSRQYLEQRGAVFEES